MRWIALDIDYDHCPMGQTIGIPLNYQENQVQMNHVMSSWVVDWCYT